MFGLYACAARMRCRRRSRRTLHGRKFRWTDYRPGQRSLYRNRSRPLRHVRMSRWLSYIRHRSISRRATRDFRSSRCLGIPRRAVPVAVPVAVAPATRVAPSLRQQCQLRMQLPRSPPVAEEGSNTALHRRAVHHRRVVHRDVHHLWIGRLNHDHLRRLLHHRNL